MRIMVLGTLVALALGLTGLAGCALVLPVVPANATSDAATPPVLAARFGDGPVTSVEDWEQRRAPLLRDALQTHIYGTLPPPKVPNRRLTTIHDDYELEGAAKLEQWTLGFGPPNDGITDRDAMLEGTLVLVLPEGREGPVPVVVMQNFCGNRAALPGRPEWARDISPVPSPCLGTVSGQLIRALFGRYANMPPWQDLLQRGYAVAIIHAADVVDDHPARARPGLDRLDAITRTAGTPNPAPLGAIGAWAWVYARVADALAADARIDPSRIAIWGHSRNGKAALLAGAMDPRIAVVIAHQSGRGGAALSRSTVGEPLGDMTRNYPHWFTPAYAGFATRPLDLPVDSHDLIALIAPRPVLLGHGRQDQWADPASAFEAAKGASPVYGLYGRRGLTQPGMVQPDLSADIAFFMRSGRHGVTRQDWDYFLDFLDSHLKPDRP